MPADEYAAVGGALRLKGAKIIKPRPKKKKVKMPDDDKAVTLFYTAAKDRNSGDDGEDESARKRDKDCQADDEPSNDYEKEDDEPSNGYEKEDDIPVVHRTEAQRRFEEAKQKRIANLAETPSGTKHSLLKTHKERVEALNTYLSKLSEHHDMPKIGPG